MKRTLLMSVAAFALAAGTTVALSQGTGGGAAGGGAGGNTPMANPSAPSGGQDTPATKQKGAQERMPAEKQKSTQQSQEKNGQGATTRQSQDEKSAPSTKQSQEKSGQTPTTQQSQSPSTGGAKQGSAERSGGGTSVTFTTEQKTRIRQTVLTSSAPRVTNVNFDIRVGTVVPRTVRIAPLPPTLIEIQPSWRGYMYFVYNDEIIVVEPGSLRIVAVIEV